MPPRDFGDHGIFRLALGHDLELLRGGLIAAALNPGDHLYALEPKRLRVVTMVDTMVKRSRPMAGENQSHASARQGGISVSLTSNLARGLVNLLICVS